MINERDNPPCVDCLLSGCSLFSCLFSISLALSNLNSFSAQCRHFVVFTLFSFVRSLRPYRFPNLDNFALVPISIPPTPSISFPPFPQHSAAFLPALDARACVPSQVPRVGSNCEGVGPCVERKMINNKQNQNRSGDHRAHLSL
jgi:hypothetical protein